MILFRLICPGALLAGMLAALGPLPAGASTSFTASLGAEQKKAAGLDSLSTAELAALDRLVAVDGTLRTHLPALTDPFTRRYTEAETKEAGLDRLTKEQLAKLDELISAVLAAAPPPSPRERPRVRDGEILSEKGRLQVHGGMSLTMGWASGGRNFREVGAWVSYFDPVSGLGLSFGFSRTSGDFIGGSYGRDYYSDTPYLFATPRTAYIPYGRLGQNDFTGEASTLRYPALLRPVGGGLHR